MKASKLVKRDHKKKGKDKPAITPEEMFASADEKESRARSRIAHLMDLLDDDSTIDDW